MDSPRSAAWPSAGFGKRSWQDIHQQMVAMATRSPDMTYMADITDSVLSSSVATQLAANTSMHDLLVAATPITTPAVEVVHVYAPRRIPGLPTGRVLIEHQTAIGRNDSIERPVEEAVRLFWRFVIEKFGVHPEWKPTSETGSGA